ncbi:hypothetical protein BDQ12DRAFT_618106 [Crucibulum laeve]|uniref:DHHA2 domain-containing protein n=1 Tax=Crucibulum laeve TaxID=68775 RepID=A0A5C3LGI6_9AGAR|nr:hypothetical protein BDQ12DRAFT_618106 [Crucibulum laeve]
MSSPLRRLSIALKFTQAHKPRVLPDSLMLAKFLSSAKEKYLKDIQEKPGKGEEWTVVMGNEAGDLDSVASSIAFAWIQSEIHKKPTIPLMQFERDELNLRAENIHALKLAGLANPREQLLTLSDVSEFKPFPSHKFALVDHNRLGSLFTTDNPSARVIAVIDHHEDEGLYTDTSAPRIIGPSGSCASHVASLLPEEIPPELATLVLCAILIDTDGLKPGGKALRLDKIAVASLVPKSTFALSVPPGVSSPDALHDAKAIKELTNDLLTMKSDLSHLGGWDLLRRDYKEYTFTLPWAPNSPSIKAGLSTVPVRLKAWGQDGKLEKDVIAWMKHRQITVLGVLTSFRDGDKPGKNGKGKHKREMAWFVLDDSEQPESVDVSALASRLWKGLEDSQELKVKPYPKFNYVQASAQLPKGSKARVYKQGNAHATRKAVAPLLKNILQPSSETPPSTEQPPQANL